MSYASIVDSQAKEVSVFARISRKRRLAGSSLTFLSGSTYYFSYTETSLDSLFVSDSYTRTEMTSVGSLGAVVASTYFWDSAAQRIYVNVSSGGVSSVGATFVVEYGLNFATVEQNWFTTPDDDSTAQILWQGGIMSTPTITRSTVDNYSGFTPSEISPLEVAITTGDLMEKAYAEDFSGCTCDIWICIGPVDPDNIQKIFTGKVNSFQSSQTSFTFSLVENVDLLDGIPDGLYYTSAYNSSEPSAFGRAIPFIYGEPRWVKATNVDYIKDAAATTNNRIWAVSDARYGTGQTYVTILTAGGLSSGQQVITMSAADRQKMIDTQFVQRSSDGAWGRIIRDGTGFTIAPIAHTAAPGDVYLRPAIQYMYFQIPSKQGLSFGSAINQSATHSSVTDGTTLQLSLTAGFEAYASSLGIAAIDPDDFEIWVRVIGPGMDQTVDGGAYLEGYTPSEVGALLWFIRTVMGVPTENINLQSFVDALAARPVNDVGQNQAYFITPCWQETFEKNRDVVNRLLQQIGAIAFFDQDGKITIKCRGVLGAADWTLTDSEIKGDSIAFEWQNQDRAVFQLDGGSSYMGLLQSRLIAKPSSTQIIVVPQNGPTGEIVGGAYNFTWSEAPLAIVQLYEFTKDTFVSGHFLYRKAIERLGQYFGARRGLLSMKAFGQIVDAAPGDIVEIQREVLPGFKYVSGTTRSRKYYLLSITRDGDSADLILEDQLSIEEKGSF